MWFGCFCFSPFIGGEEINKLNNLNFFNKCPKCGIGTIFIGLIKLKKNCDFCYADLGSEKIGDGASWITCSILCFFIVPILFFFEIRIGIKIQFYFLLIFPSLLILSILLLRVLRYLLLKKYSELP